MPQIMMRKTTMTTWIGALLLVTLVARMFPFLLDPINTFASIKSTRRPKQQQQKQRIKVFSMASNHPNARRQQKDIALLAQEMEHVVMNTHQQRSFLESSTHICGDAAVARFDELLQAQQSHLALQVWNYCALYMHGGVLLDSTSSLSSGLVLLVSLDALILDTEIDASINKNVNKAILNDVALFPESLHGSFLYLSQPHSTIAYGMLQVLLNTSITSLQTLPLLLPQTLYTLVQHELSLYYNLNENTTTIRPGQQYNNVGMKSNNSSRISWYFLEQKCSVTPIRFLPDHRSTTRPFRNRSSTRWFRWHHHSPCPEASEYCCHVYDTETPAIVGITSDPLSPYPILPSLDQLPKPFHVTDITKFSHQHDLPYISTVRERRLLQNAAPAAKERQQHSINSSSTTTTPDASNNSNLTNTNLFDALSQINCLPSDDCIYCLRQIETGTLCEKCQKDCGCFCQLCNISNVPPPVTVEMMVRPPRYRRDPTRLIPRIIHQTWHEEIHVDQYPNTGRLAESFRQSGWDYRFYTDDMSATFLTTHFPPEVRQAYDALVPGAFKADLFRYCVLLIHGGLYADFDILLESNLDAAIGPDVGFFIPYDSLPGADIGHRMCLWNGFMAAAPGHPFLAKVIEMVVNHVRNRFTVVEFSHMFCPNPLCTIHKFDDLFVTGPCLLGAAVNQMLERDPQAQFEAGEQSHKNATVTLPGRTIVLEDKKQDMGAHRFTLLEKSMIVAGTDFPDVDDRRYPVNVSHYSSIHYNGGIYGLKGLYQNNHHRANENVRFVLPDDII